MLDLLSPNGPLTRRGYARRLLIGLGTCAAGMAWVLWDSSAPRRASGTWVLAPWLLLWAWVYLAQTARRLRTRQLSPTWMLLWLGPLSLPAIAAWAPAWLPTASGPWAWWTWGLIGALPALMATAWLAVRPDDPRLADGNMADGAADPTAAPSRRTRRNEGMVHRNRIR